MDYLKRFGKKIKDNHFKNCKMIQQRYRDGIWLRYVCNINHENATDRIEQIYPIIGRADIQNV